MASDSSVKNDSLDDGPSDRSSTDDTVLSNRSSSTSEVTQKGLGDDDKTSQQPVKDSTKQDSSPKKLTARPPLPLELPPSNTVDDGWDPIWDETAQAYYFYNRFNGASQWTNPRVPDSQPLVSGVGNYDRMPDHAPGTTSENTSNSPARPHGGYDPAIHGDYDPTAAYAQDLQTPFVDEDTAGAVIVDPDAIYTATGVFNRFTGKWQPSTITPENHNDENKSKRQMSAFFDVDAAANSHNGKSLKAERSGKKLTKQELKAFKEKRKERKEEKRRAWLRD